MAAKILVFLGFLRTNHYFLILGNTKYQNSNFTLRYQISREKIEKQKSYEGLKFQKLGCTVCYFPYFSWDGDFFEVISIIKRCVYFINYVFCMFSVCFLCVFCPANWLRLRHSFDFYWMKIDIFHFEIWIEIWTEKGRR